MRFNDQITLVSTPEKAQDAAGAWHAGKPTKVHLYCNPRTVGSYAWATAVDAGLRADAEVEVRTQEYEALGSPQLAFYHGVECDVEKVSVKGDMTRLQLGRHVRNGE